jgi:hypothetical protein
LSACTAPLVDAGQAHFEIVRHADHAGNALRRRLGLEFLRVAADEAGQGNHAVLDGRGDVGRIDVRIPPELVFHVTFDVGIGSHDCFSLSGRRHLSPRQPAPP